MLTQLTMKSYKFLSYFSSEETIIYGGNKGLLVKKLTDISFGDSANTKELVLHNHLGTHIDFPNHFIEDGKKSCDYEADFWIFDNPYLLNINFDSDEIIDLDESSVKKIPEKTDFLIFNTGYNKYRGEKKFWNNNPGFSPHLASKLRNRCPLLRVLGMDTISLSGYQNRDIGRISHKEFLGKNEILLVEDMNLNDMTDCPSRIMCFPLQIKEIDGCPVTIIAEFK